MDRWAIAYYFSLFSLSLFFFGGGGVFGLWCMILLCCDSTQALFLYFSNQFCHAVGCSWAAGPLLRSCTRTVARALFEMWWVTAHSLACLLVHAVKINTFYEYNMLDGEPIRMMPPCPLPLTPWRTCTKKHDIGCLVWSNYLAIFQYHLLFLVCEKYYFVRKYMNS